MFGFGLQSQEEGPSIPASELPSPLPMRGWQVQVEPAELPGDGIVFVGEDLVMEAQAFISHCESCAPEAVDHLTFDYVLDAISDCDPRTTQYLMCRPAHCPHCSSPVSEKTLVVAR